MAVLRECTPATDGAAKCRRHKVGASPCEAVCTLRFFHIKRQLGTSTSSRSLGCEPGITRAMAPSGMPTMVAYIFRAKKRIFNGWLEPTRVLRPFLGRLAVPRSAQG